MQLDAKPIILSSKAKRQLRSLHRYVSKVSSSQRADNFLIDLKARIDRIALAPEQGTRQPDLHPDARRTGYIKRVAV